MTRPSFAAICATFAAGLSLACFTLASPVQARPGTPSRISMAPCFLPRGNQDFPPNLCVRFHVTPEPAVVFEYEMTLDGRPFDFFHAGLRAKCDMEGEGPACHADRNFNGDFGARSAINYGDASFELDNLDYDRTYCIRVRERDASGGLGSGEVSQVWSAWACWHTYKRRAALHIVVPTAPMALAAPAAPDNIHFFSDDKANPWRLTVEWSYPDRAKWFTVEARATRSDVKFYFKNDDLGRMRMNAFRDTKLLVYPDRPDLMRGEGVVVRVCAHNESGAACSPWVSSLGDRRPANWDRDRILRQGPPRQLPDPARSPH